MQVCFNCAHYVLILTIGLVESFVLQHICVFCFRLQMQLCEEECPFLQELACLWRFYDTPMDLDKRWCIEMLITLFLHHYITLPFYLWIILSMIVHPQWSSSPSPSPSGHWLSGSVSIISHFQSLSSIHHFTFTLSIPRSSLFVIMITRSSAWLPYLCSSSPPPNQPYSSMEKRSGGFSICFNFFTTIDMIVIITTAVIMITTTTTTIMIFIIASSSMEKRSGGFSICS